MARVQLDSLADRVIDPQDQVLFHEAVRAGNANAPRSAFIAIWLSCAESLKRKFKEAAAYDGAAKHTVGEILRREASHQAIDAFILKEAKDYGFVSDTEFVHLNAMYEQRCIYGHPYEQAPLPEQLAAAAATAVEYVLSRPVRLRHGYLDRQVDMICSELTFLDDHYPAIDAYARLVHDRSSADLHLWFLQKLWSKADGFVVDPAMSVFTRRVVWLSAAFLGYCEAPFFASWDVAQDVVAHPIIASVLVTASLFPRIGEHAQDIVLGMQLSAAKTQATALRAVESLGDTGALTARQSTRLLETMTSLPLSALASSGVNPRFYAKRIIGDLKSYTWPTQNPAIDIVRHIGPSGVARLADEEQAELGRNILQAADGKAHSAAGLLAEIARGDAQWPEPFVEGIVAECVVNDAGQYRFKTKCAAVALTCLRSASPEGRVAIIGRVVASLRTASPKRTWSLAADRDDMLREIDKATVQDAPQLAALGALRKFLGGMEMPVDE